MGATQHAHAARLDGFSVSMSLLQHSPSEDAIALVQSILEEDDAETSLCDLHDLIAYHNKASEFAAILQEHSSSPPLNEVPTAQHDTLTQQPCHAESPQIVELFANIPQLQYPATNRVVLLNTLNSCQRPCDIPSSKVLDVGAFKSLLNIAATACEEENADASAVVRHLCTGFNHKETKRTSDMLKPRKDLSFGKPRLNKFGNMSNSKTRHIEEFMDISIDMAGLPTYLHLHDMLLHCAHEIGQNNNGSAIAIACRIKQQISAHGTATECLAYYFVKALCARVEGTGWSLYAGHLSQDHPFSRRILEAGLRYMSSCPFAKASHFFMNQKILKAAKGASTLNILDHQMTGIQYSSLFKELAALPGGPPKVRLVGFKVPHYSLLSAQKDVISAALEETGRRLSKRAESFGVPFQFIPWVGAREEIRLQDFVSSERSPDEVLVLISACFQRFVMDDILDSHCMRLRIFKTVYDLKPDVYIQGVVSGAYSSPFYLLRFKEALFHFACVYDVLDTFVKRDNQDRLLFESEVLGKAILNIVACEGPLVSGRVQKYSQWQATTIEAAGIQQLPMDKDMIGKVQCLLQSWHKDYMVSEDKQYLLMGWRGRVLYALSAWKSPARPG